MRTFLTLLVVGFLTGPVSAQVWKPLESGSNARIRGLSVAGPGVAWASGAAGTCLITTDGGSIWKSSTIPDASTLDFRDVQGFDDQTACLLSIGEGPLSRIYRTSDGGQTWSLSLTNPDAKGFLDAFAFWDANHGLALGDPVDGKFVILRTSDGGRTWSKSPADGMPASLPGEGGFAASGTCLAVQGESNAWFGTGGGSSARIFRTTDRGQTWTVVKTPVQAGQASRGIFSVAFRNADQGVAVGGDYKEENNSTGNLAMTNDGGRTWSAIEGSRPSGFRSAVAWVPGSSEPELLTVGPSGSDVSTDGGKTWSKLGSEGFHTLSFGPFGRSAWAAGERGRVARLDLAPIRQP